MADEAVADRLERAVHRLGMPFQARLAPANRAVLAFHAHEQPARWHVEGLDAADFHGCSSIKSSATW
jgi:hypothetical protein